MIRINLLKPPHGAGGGDADSSRSAGTARIGWTGLVASVVVLATAGGLAYYLGSSGRNVSRPKGTPAPPVAQQPTPAAAAGLVSEAVAAERAAPQKAKATSAAAIIEAKDLSIEKQPGKLLVTLHASAGELRYRVTRLANPARLAIDLSNCRLVAPRERHSRNVDDPHVKRVRVGQFQVDPPVCRLVLDLTSFPRHEITPGPEGLRIQVWNEAGER